MAFSRDTNKEKINFIIELSLYQQHTLAGSRASKQTLAVSPASKHRRARDLFGRRRPLRRLFVGFVVQVAL